MNLPTGVRGRWVALGLLAIVLTLLFQLTLAPLWQRYRALAPAIAEQRDQVQRFRALAAQAPALETRLATLRDDVRFDDYLLPGASSALAAAALQQRLKEVTEEQRGQVLSTRVAKPQQAGEFERVMINARLQMDLAGLQGLLHALETRPPYLFLHNLNIYRQARGRATKGDRLDVQLDLYGLRLPGEQEDDRG